MFVTHDIDEAVKLGDRIAIMREGRLVQDDTPERVLAYPADEFVAGFVGGERALKRLSLAPVFSVMDPVGADSCRWAERSAEPPTCARRSLASSSPASDASPSSTSGGGRRLAERRRPDVALPDGRSE